LATAVISDLHLGTRSEADVLRHGTVRRVLFDALRDADEVVLLGDVLELREQPLPDVLEIARPFFEELAEALPGRRITVVAGNHDHRVVAEWLEERRIDGAPPLGLEHRIPTAASKPLAALAARMPGVEVELAYPGLWLRPGTYATHGHYLDCHMTVPRLEAIALSATARVTGGMPGPPRTPDDYEATIAPLYAFAYALAQGGTRARRVLGMDLSRRVWSRIDGRRDLASRALSGALIPAAVWSLNRAGMGPFEARLSGARLRESGLRAMQEVVAALSIDAGEVVFGHTHRPGPLPRDTGWDSRLFNTGSWLYEPNLVAPVSADSPYWPGTAIFVRPDQPLELRRLLVDHEIGPRA
jgi:predicted phosphodiesterase